jgi:glycosyltransferase involved in cell wall biosynthesis
MRPLVSCMMPTHNRREFIPRAVELFLAQDYPERELIVLDDGSDPIEDLMPTDPTVRYVRLEGRRTIGAKRNLACEISRGSIVAHWDDDDWMARWRLSYQVSALLGAPSAQACGLARLRFHEPASGRNWEYVSPPTQRPWVAGGTLCYWKALWTSHHFSDLDEGEDSRFVWSLPAGSVLSLPDSTFYVATVHPGNTSPKKVHDPRWRLLSPENRIP